MKKISKLNKSTLIFLIVAITLVSVLAVSGISYAIWMKVSEDNQELNLPIADYNPSEKYIIFRGLDEDNNFSDVTGKEVVAYAAVGYDSASLVAEVVIPSEYKPSDDAEAKPVIKICNSNIGTDSQHMFIGNPIITSIVIPASVKEIAVSACAEMPLLESIEIMGEDEITIGDYAFANCPLLQTFTCNRSVIGARELYLMGSNL